MKHVLPIWIALGLAAAASPTLRAATNAAAPPSVADTYRLNIQDKLLFTVREDPIKTPEPDEVYVNALGKAHFRVSAGFDEIITLNASGKTLPQLKEELMARLLADYYEQATVDLKLKEATQRVGKVLFYGAVRGNFLQLLPGEAKTIFEGVYQVGVTEFANLKKVKLSRLNPRTRQSDTWIINLEAIKKGDRALDVWLQDGDRIEVPEKGLVW